MSATNRGAVRKLRDFYETPGWVTEALIDREPLHGPVLDPACGDGAILKVLHRRGVGPLAGNDIEPGEAECYLRRCSDYLQTPARPRWPSVVMNPPYRLAADFVRVALADVVRGGKVCALLRLNFLGSSRKRLDLVGPGSQLRAVHALSRRPSFTGDGRSDACDYAWFIWEAGYQGAATLTVIEP